MRYGLDLNRQDIIAVLDDIHHDRAILVERPTKTYAKYMVNLKGQPVIVVYDRITRNLKTVLPSEAEEWKKPLFCPFTPRSKRKAKDRKLD